jgi:hypothetical protein
VRALADLQRINELMQAFGRAASHEVRVYFVGGTTAVLMGWRPTTIDVDFVMRPEDDALLRSIPTLKERLHINLEMASPADFIPVPEGWEDRSTYIHRVAPVTFYHYDLYAQALAKIERGHAQDLADVRDMVARGLVERRRALAYFESIEPRLYKFPAVDAPSFRRAVEEVFGSAK